MPIPARATFSTTQPGKSIWATLHLLLNTARLPIWLLYFIPKGLRQDPRWSWRQAVAVRVFKAIIAFASHIEIATPILLTPGPEEDQWVTFNPTASKYYTGVALADPEIKPTQIGGTWYPSPPSASEKPKKIILHFHGGAYIVGDGRKKDAGFMCKTLYKNTDISHVLSCQYRLASNPRGQFPAALQDAITAYTYVLFELGYNASQVVVTGDSAGANLTLCLLRYITDHGKSLGLPAPSCAWLWSPWVDPNAIIREPKSLDTNPRSRTDYLTTSFARWGAECFTPSKSTGLTSESKHINFLQNPFKTETPLYFSICENEVLFADGQQTFKAFSAIPGNKVEITVEEYAPHDIILVGKQIGFQKEAARAAQKAGKWTANL